MQVGLTDMHFDTNDLLRIEKKYVQVLYLLKT